MFVKQSLPLLLIAAALAFGCRKRETAPAGPEPAGAAAESVSSPAETAPLPAAERPIAELEKAGVKFAFEKDGKLKSADFSAADGPAAFDDAEKDRWNTLRVLRGKGLLSDTLARQAAECPKLTECLWLETEISPLAFRALAGISTLKKLRLTGLSAESADLDLLAGLPELAELDFSDSSLTDDSLKALAALPALSRLNLYRNRIGDEGVRNLVPLAEKLVWLNLDATQITDEAGPSLAQFSRLKFLHLGRTAVTDEIIGSLAGLADLETVHVTRTGITEAGAEKLRAALPNTEVISVVQENE